MERPGSSGWLDRPKAVRKGEALDVEALAGFLSERLPELGDGWAVEQFPGGFSNLTYLVRNGDQELVLRRPPFGSKVSSAHDMGREYRVLAALSTVYSKVPRPLAYCDDPEVIGAPFYVMERVAGVILRPRMPEEMVPAPELMRRIGESLVDALAELHAVDYTAAGLRELGRPEGYVERQVAGWRKRWAAARTDDVPAMEEVGSWLEENRPSRSGAALIHNDFKYDNLVLDPDDWSRVVAVLDWEMATLGDPLMDLGSSLAYWVDPDDPPELLALRLSPTTLPGNPSRAEIAERYAATSGREIGDLVFYYAYGLFKLAVIVQQIFYRFRKGLTSDPRFAHLDQGVRAAATAAAQATRLGRIDRLFGD
jgi:aminoglycoside phosphotransferase (APT) family kinase protein